MTSIPAAICQFSDKTFKRFYLKKERPFADFLLHFRNVHEIWNILNKKEYPSLIIAEITASERDIYLIV